jgi:hypothetical protein
MSLLRKAPRGSVGSVAVTVALIALVSAGCGGGATTSDSQANRTPTPTPQTNGLEEKSVADVLYAAAGALKTATSVHLIGVGRREGKWEARIQGARSSGTMELKGIKLHITIIGTTTYIKTDADGWTAMGLPASIARQVNGRWVKMPADSNFTVKGFTVADVAASISKHADLFLPKVEQTTLNGMKVVVVSARNGPKLYVANTGPAYPVRVTDTEGEANYTYGEDFHITAPTDFIDGDTVLASH